MEDLVRADKFIVLFDGVCKLCNAFVAFLIRHDKHDRLRFATLQSAEKYFPDGEFRDKILLTDSVALIAEGKIYFRSTAVLKILNKLGGGWKLFYVLMIIPNPVRDWAYDRVALNRYRWFGKKDSCMIPDEKLSGKFIYL
jgi:predicted DCC family thiol-disulfide oxidoreductase YuxK